MTDREPCRRCGHSWGQHWATGPYADCIQRGCECPEYLAPVTDGHSSTDDSDGGDQGGDDPIGAET